jgi:uncharacterized protein (TIRG00374 family)
MDFVVLSCLVIATTFLNGLIIKALMEFFKIRIKAREWFGLSVVSSFGNYLPLRMGIVAKAVYLRKIHDFPYTHFISALGATYIVMFLSCGLIGMVGMSAVYFAFSAFSVVLFVLYAVIFLGALFFVIFPPKDSLSKRRFTKNIRDVIKGWDLIRKDKKLLLNLAYINVLLIFIYALRIYYASFALGYNFPFLCVLVIALPSLLSIFLTIIPGGFGIREAAIGFSFKLLGGEVTTGIVAGSLDRVVSFTWVVFLGAIFTWVLLRKV